MNRRFRISALTVLAFLLCALSAWATDLDLTFSGDGRAYTNVGDESSASDAKIQSDGKILVAGSTEINNLRYFLVVRYNENGTLDNSFGTNGVKVIDFLGDTASAHALALQPDGKIVVAGSRTGASADFALARLMPDGSLDNSFDNNGRVFTDISGTEDSIWDVKVQADGHILAAGYTSVAGLHQFAVAMYKSDGTLESSFGNGGIMIDDIGGGNDEIRAAAIAFGRLTVAGVSDSDFTAARYLGAGLDNSFGLNGIVNVDLGGTEVTTGVAVLSNGKTILSGYTYNAGFEFKFSLARLNPDGSLDNTFGTGGITITDSQLGPARAEDMAILSDGRIVLAGKGGSGDKFIIACYTPDGILDSSFGDGGFVSTDFSGTSDGASGLAIQSDDKIVATGYTADTNTAGIATARYYPKNFLYYDDFEDSVPTWTELKGDWIEEGGVLHNDGTKGEVLVPLPWTQSGGTGCTTCTFNTVVMTNYVESTLILQAWYKDKNNLVQLVMKEEKDKWVLKQQVNGDIVAKESAKMPVTPGVYYKVTLSYDGAVFHVLVDGVEVITLPAAATPEGSFAFKVKNTEAVMRLLSIY